MGDDQEDRPDFPDLPLDGPENRFARDRAFLAHASGPFLGALGPMILFAIQAFRRDPSRFARRHTVQALFFQAALWILSILLFLILPCGFSMLLFVLLYLSGIVCTGLALRETVRGRPYRYPIVGEWADAYVGSDPS